MFDFFARCAPVGVMPRDIERPEIPPPREEPSILFFGRISYYKRLDVLLDSMRGAWRQIPSVDLRVVGAGEIQDHPVADPRVTLQVGHAPDADLPALFGDARCVALPYRQASQSGVGSVAKGFGRPLTATAVGKPRELVSDGSGRLVPPKDPERLADTLLGVLSDAELPNELSAAAVRRAAHSGWGHVAAVTLAAYRERLPR